MRIAGGFDDLADDPPGRRIGQIHVDRKQRSLRKEDQPLAIGAQGRREIEIATRTLAVINARPNASALRVVSKNGA